MGQGTQVYEPHGWGRGGVGQREECVAEANSVSFNWRLDVCKGMKEVRWMIPEERPRVDRLPLLVSLCPQTSLWGEVKEVFTKHLSSARWWILPWSLRVGRARWLAQGVPGSSIMGQHTPRVCSSNGLLYWVRLPVFCCKDVPAASHASFQAVCCWGQDLENWAELYICNNSQDKVWY